MSIRKGSSILAGNGGSGGGSAMNVDNITTELNQSQEIQAVGVIEKNKSLPKYDWIGTYEEWTTAKRNDEIDDDWICYITDDDGANTKTSKERTLGEIIFSLIQLDDPALHLLDGSLIDGTGVYNQFYTYMKNLYDNGYRKCFTTEENWQTSSTTYGACGKFVLNTTNQTIRLPKITGFIEGTLDETEIGDLIEAGLPNITGIIGAAHRMGGESSSGAFKDLTTTQASNQGGGSDNSSVEFNSSWSNSIYGNSTTVQPQSIKGFYYIVLATSISLDASLDIGSLVNNVNNKADKNLVNTGYLSNCITEIPQDIKLELNDGVLTLKAGSKVYVPNGFEQDGTTHKFDEVIIESDIVANTPSSNTTAFIVYDSDRGSVYASISTSNCESGSTNPTTGSGYFYNTTTNILTYHSGSTYEERLYSLPLGIITKSDSGITIDQVFNGFGYIGSTIFALPGVKGLIPNGRNADGTLKNKEFSVGNVIVSTIAGSRVNSNLYINEREIGYYARKFYSVKSKKDITSTNEVCIFYVEDENIMYTVNNVGEIQGSTDFIPYATHNDTSDKITSFNTKLVFHALDYNDKGTVSGWGLPSNKYIDLTLNASGSTYTAPANGWVSFVKKSTASGQYMYLGRVGIEDYGVNVVANASGQESNLLFPFRKGEKIVTSYNYGGATSAFRFIYAEGEV